MSVSVHVSKYISNRPTAGLTALAVCLLTALAVSSCRFHEDEFVDFTNIEAAKGLSFQVIGQHETDLEQGLPSNCYLPDGIPANAYSDDMSDGPQARKTSSVTGAAIIQELLKYGCSNCF